MPMIELITGTEGLGIDTTKFSTLVLQQNGDTVVIMFIKVIEEHKGTFRNLITDLEAKGKKVQVFHPVIRTREIIAKMGFAPETTQVWAKTGKVATQDEIDYGRNL
jgi:hypothetical protein